MLAAVPAQCQSANYGCTGVERFAPDPASRKCQGYMPEELFPDLSQTESSVPLDLSVLPDSRC